SPVTTHTPLLGAEIRLDAGATVDLPVTASFEHGLLVDSGQVELENVALPTGALGYTGVGSTELRISNRSGETARLILLGGEPCGEEGGMWWKVVGRTHEASVAFREQWQAEGERFGAVDGYIARGGPGRTADGLGRRPAPRLPDVTIRARGNPSPQVQGGPDETQ